MSLWSSNLGGRPGEVVLLGIMLGFRAGPDVVPSLISSTTRLLLMVISILPHWGLPTTTEAGLGGDGRTVPLRPLEAWGYI